MSYTFVDLAKLLGEQLHVLAYRGTDDWQVDLIDDATIILGWISGQMGNARDALRASRERVRGVLGGKICLTGHSLGGGLAALIAAARFALPKDGVQTLDQGLQAVVLRIVERADADRLRGTYDRCAAHQATLSAGAWHAQGAGRVRTGHGVVGAIKHVVAVMSARGSTWRRITFPVHSSCLRRFGVAS